MEPVDVDNDAQDFHSQLHRKITEYRWSLPGWLAPSAMQFLRSCANTASWS